MVYRIWDMSKHKLTKDFFPDVSSAEAYVLSMGAGKEELIIILTTN